MASESRIAQVATTIPVRNVQDLAACDAGELTADALERYVRPDIDKDAVLYEHSGELPVVDLGRLNPQHWEEEAAAKLRYACEEWGFFQVLNHGVPEEVMVSIKRDIQEFFELPLDVKNAYAQTPGDLQGYGQAYVFSNDQKLDWKSLEDYSAEVEKVAHSIATAIGKILNIDPELMSDKYAVQVLRMNYYPPCTSMPEKVLGFSPHSDGSFLTILSQVNSVEGLQIKRHDAWVPVKPHPEALLVNVGDFLELGIDRTGTSSDKFVFGCGTAGDRQIMTNGKFKSIEHRVIINAHKERLSVSAFHSPKFDGVVSPATATPTENLLYRTVKVEVEMQKLSQIKSKKSLEDYSAEVEKVAHSIATAIGKILNIDPELMSDKYAVQVLRMNYYPPCTSMPEKVLGFSPHSDGSFLTILSQVNSVEGFQIKRHDAWVPVKPHPEALLVNVGDFLELGIDRTGTSSDVLSRPYNFEGQLETTLR
ncbi:Protein SRG1 [Zea mays]|uniref:Protein SRG1 n=1 Tax=Zea mays TaxID=4577 RepID=A0A1D6MU21_MAIZE|nr:Protein SRG1 [Zea mays]